MLFRIILVDVLWTCPSWVDNLGFVSLLKARLLYLDQTLSLLIDWEIVFLQLFRSDILAWSF